MGNSTVALVTGGNQGIGFEICRQLGRKGITVIVGARDAGKGERAADKLAEEGIRSHSVQLDVTDQQTVEKAREFVEAEFGKLDVLVNNAGIFLPEGLPSETDVNRLKEIYETNVFGVFRVTQAMLPLLRKSEAGRIVNMSSSLGSLSLNGDPDFELASFLVLGYNSSKTAVNALTVFFANELRGTNILVNSADPGYCATNMTNYAGGRSAEEGARAAVRLATLSDGEATGGFFDEKGRVAW